VILPPAILDTGRTPAALDGRLRAKAENLKTLSEYRGVPLLLFDIGQTNIRSAGSAENAPPLKNASNGTRSLCAALKGMTKK
jgi:hypothetical protein